MKLKNLQDIKLRSKLPERLKRSISLAEKNLDFDFFVIELSSITDIYDALRIVFWKKNSVIDVLECQTSNAIARAVYKANGFGHIPNEKPIRRKSLLEHDLEQDQNSRLRDATGYPK